MARAWKIPRLGPGEPLASGLKKMIAVRCRETFSYAPATLRGDDPDALHDMRVAARRLQAVLRLHRECFTEKQFLRVYRPLRDLIRSLGTVRELDVLIDWLNRKAAALPPEDRFALELLIARTLQRRTEAVQSMQAFLRSVMENNLGARILHFAAHNL